MILNPKSSIYETVLSDVSEKQIQPNGVDLRISEAYRILDGAFHLSEVTKTEKPVSKIEPDQNNVFLLTEGFYRIKYEQTIVIPPCECGLVMPRSSLIRNGVLVHTALYDTGYGYGDNVKPGEMWGLLQVTSGTFLVERGTRIAQYISIYSNTQDTLYSGQYQKKNNEVKEDNDVVNKKEQ